MSFAQELVLIGSFDTPPSLFDREGKGGGRLPTAHRHRATKQQTSSTLARHSRAGPTLSIFITFSSFLSVSLEERSKRANLGLISILISQNGTVYAIFVRAWPNRRRATEHNVHGETSYFFNMYILLISRIVVVDLDGL